MSILIVVSICFHILHFSIPETSCCGDELMHGELESTHISKVKGHLPVYVCVCVCVLGDSDVDELQL